LDRGSGGAGEVRAVWGPLVVAYILPGVEVSTPYVGFIVAIVLTLLNTIVKPVLIILTLPITIVTLGIFLLVINGLIVLIANNFIDGFSVSNLFTAIIFSLLVSLINGLMGIGQTDRKRDS
jgi:putative membrane protein